MTEVSTARAAAGIGRTVTRAEVEDFLFHEADLLDRWQLDAWFALMAEDSVYEVPTNDWTGWSVLEGGYFKSDDYGLLTARIKRLKSRKAHAENPHSRTQRMISNVIVGERAGDLVEIRANFIVHRFRDDTTQAYVGRYEHLLEVTETGFVIRRRRAVLINESMAPGARLSFIL